VTTVTERLVGNARLAPPCPPGVLVISEGTGMLEKIGCISEVNIGWVALAVAGDSEQQKLSRLDLSALLTESLCSRRSISDFCKASCHPVQT